MVQKRLKLRGDVVSIIRDVIFLVVYLDEALKEQIDIRGLLKDDDIFNQVTKNMERLENEQAKEPIVQKSNTGSKE